MYMYVGLHGYVYNGRSLEDLLRYMYCGQERRRREREEREREREGSWGGGGGAL